MNGMGNSGQQHKKKRDKPQIVTYTIPKIEVYQVTDSELTTIETSHGHVSQDFTFATISLSLGVAFLIALLTTTPSSATSIIFTIVIIVCAFVFLYTGIRWWRTRNTLPNVVADIRSRKVAPEVLPPPPTRDTGLT
jgi:hypothetical protein